MTIERWLQTDERLSRAWMQWVVASRWRSLVARVWASVGLWVLFASVLAPVCWRLCVQAGWWNGTMYFTLVWLLPLAFFVFLVSGFFAFIVARIFPRKRPFQSHANWKSLIGTTWLHWAFPSKHTVFATTLACFAVVMASMDMTPWWQVGVLMLGVLTLGAARVGCGVHYWGDILGGIIVGIAVSICVWLLALLLVPAM